MPPTAPPDRSPGPRPEVRILIVEDEVIVAMQLQHHLESLGYHVVDAVSTGKDAIERATALSPDLVVMDVKLDGAMDGIEAAARIRAVHHTAIVFLTAYGDQDTLSRASALAPGGYLLKPFDGRSLHTTIEIALHNRRLERELQRSHEDLVHVLNGLDIGTVMTDDAGRITFASRSAAHWLRLDLSRDLLRPWLEAFPLPQGTLERLQDMAVQPPDRRRRVPAALEHPDGSTFWMDIAICDDPRSPGRRLFVLYDTSEIHDLRRLLDQNARYHNIIGKSTAMQQVFAHIEQVARVDSTVLILGETGAGKELVARAIHKASPRGKGPFVAVNCAALSEELAASQLFGHRKGAFTGALMDHKGFFEAADGGTLFLDEIGDIPLEVQVNLLRVLEERAVLRVGDTRPRAVNVRIVAATHRDLTKQIEEGRFRADLFYRIRVGRVELPGLRERREDIPLLVRAFLQECRTTMGIAAHDVSREAMRRLVDYGWPGNVRELRNAIEYAVIRSRGPVVSEEDLPPEILGHDPFLSLRVEDADVDRSRILAALEQAGGNRKAAAKLLGMSRATFYRRLDAYNISP